MRMDAVQYRANQYPTTESDARTSDDQHSDPQPNLMTPARRAALDALERELNDLLKRRPR
jgi:hypothetical protein